MKTFSILGIILIIAQLALAQPANRMSKEDAARFAQQKFREIAQLWQEQKIAEGVAILETLYAIPAMREFEQGWTGILYNLACGYSRLGNKEKALDFLSRAVESGFTNLRQIANDPDLANIRNESRFRVLLAKLKADQQLWDGRFFNTPFRENLSEEEKLAGLARVWSEVKYNFVYFNRVPSLNWDSLYLAYLPRIKQSKSTREYYRLLEQMCARLKDGHTGINLPPQLFTEQYARPAVQTARIEGRVIIVKLLNDELFRQGIQPGMEIVSIDGLPVQEYVEQYVAPYVNASTPQGWEVGCYDFYLLCGSKDQPVVLELRDSSGKTLRTTLPRNFYRLRSFTRALEFRKLRGNIAYVALNSFAQNKVAEQFDSLFSEIKHSAGLIIDLRNNTGGNSSVGYTILGYLTDKPFTYLRWKTRTYNPYYRASGRKQEWTEEPPGEWPANGVKWYSGPVALLIGPRTGSAAEDFCVAFDYMQRGTMFGEPTAGSTGQPLVYSLPGGGSGTVCTIRNYYPDGREFVGIGIQPDIRVHQTIEDVRTRRDPVLETAMRTLEGNRRE